MYKRVCIYPRTSSYGGFELQREGVEYGGQLSRKKRTLG
jgi:hypothetical protein